MKLHNLPQLPDSVASSDTSTLRATWFAIGATLVVLALMIIAIWSAKP